jgi:hypothetical protein
MEKLILTQMEVSVMSDIKIENDVPLPKKKQKVPDLPLSDMEVGDSFTMGEQTDRMKNAIRQRLVRYQKSNQPVKFSMITEENGHVRIFRVEDQQ